MVFVLFVLSETEERRLVQKSKKWCFFESRNVIINSMTAAQKSCGSIDVAGDARAITLIKLKPRVFQDEDFLEN